MKTNIQKVVHSILDMEKVVTNQKNQAFLNRKSLHKESYVIFDNQQNPYLVKTVELGLFAQLTAFVFAIEENGFVNENKLIAKSSFVVTENLLEPTKVSGWLNELWVLNPFDQGKGLGTQMLNLMVYLAHTKGATVLEGQAARLTSDITLNPINEPTKTTVVEKDNLQQLIKFYENRNFKYYEKGSKIETPILENNIKTYESNLFAFSENGFTFNAVLPQNCKQSVQNAYLENKQNSQFTLNKN